MADRNELCVLVVFGDFRKLDPEVAILGDLLVPKVDHEKFVLLDFARDDIRVVEVLHIIRHDSMKEVNVCEGIVAEKDVTYKD